MPARGAVLVAPDKFKGSLSAPDVTEHIVTGLRAGNGTVEAIGLPIADGGDGFRAAVSAAGYHDVPVDTVGPLGDPLRSGYSRRGDTAVVELAETAGLGVLPCGRPRPMDASTEGTGRVIRDAIEHGCRTVVLGVGGSASTDGGTGLLHALGADLSAGRWPTLDGSGPVSPTAVDLHALRVRCAGVRFVIAADVDNPLLGPRGAATVYGPQKGADPHQVTVLEKHLAHWADLLDLATGTTHRYSPGAGAAGGVGYALLAALDAELRPGIELVLDLVDVDAALARARLVITGEGALDEQTLHGKAVVGVAARAASAGVPVVAVAGRNRLTPQRLRTAGITAAYCLTDLEPDVGVCLRNPGPLLQALARRIARDWRPELAGTVALRENP